VEPPSSWSSCHFDIPLALVQLRTVELVAEDSAKPSSLVVIAERGTRPRSSQGELKANEAAGAEDAREHLQAST
jgi:hypothetical protein